MCFICKCHCKKWLGTQIPGEGISATPKAFSDIYAMGDQHNHAADFCKGTVKEGKLQDCRGQGPVAFWFLYGMIRVLGKKFFGIMSAIPSLWDIWTSYLTLKDLGFFSY